MSKLTKGTIKTGRSQNLDDCQAQRNYARLETVDVSEQPHPHPALKYISNTPIQTTSNNKVYCTGNGGSLGHPIIFINLVLYLYNVYE